jgi:TonB family protein
MFNNLIESSSHAREFKRRGSFVAFTTAIYAVLFIVAGVASIYAYDARLEDQNLEYVTMLSPLDFQPAPAPEHNAATPPRANNNQSNLATRAVAMARVDMPVVPEKTSATPNVNKPIPEHGNYRLGDRDSDPVVAGGTGHGNNTSGSSTANLTPSVDVGAPPPPVTPPVRKSPAVISKGVITGLALALPRPAYPVIAKQARAAGPVNVQVLIDETGRVVSAKAVSGHPLLLAAAQQAAFSARFSPTRLGDQAVKVSGVITYNFVLNQ